MVDEKPYEFTLPRPGTCVVVVDMQNDFCAPEGFFARVGADVSACVDTIPRIAWLLTAARRNNVPVVYTRMSNPADNMLPAQHRILPLRDRASARTAVCVTGSWGADVIAELTPHSGDLVIDKAQYSAFFRTDLEAQLRDQGIDTLVIVGATTNACIDSTVRDAYFRGFDVVVVADAVASYEQSIHQSTLTNIDLLFGAVARSDYVMQQITRDEALTQ